MFSIGKSNSLVFQNLLTLYLKLLFRIAMVVHIIRMGVYCLLRGPVIPYSDQRKYSKQAIVFPSVPFLKNFEQTIARILI